MEILQFKTGDVIASKNDKVNNWYIIQEGSVIQKNEFVKTLLGSNAIIGILEQDFFICDYIAETDCKLINFPCKNDADLRGFLEKEPRMRPLFLRTAIVQSHQQFEIYTDLNDKASDFASCIEKCHEAYQMHAMKYHIDDNIESFVTQFTPLEMAHKATGWEIDNSKSIVDNYLAEYMKLYTKDDSLCIGAIMEASYKMHRVAQGIGEMIAFFQYNKELLISTKGRDLFHSMLQLKMRLAAVGGDSSEIDSLISRILSFARSLHVYTEENIDIWTEEFENAKDEVMEDEPVVTSDDKSDMEYIFEYAGYSKKEISKLIILFTDYSRTIKSSNRDDAATATRKEVLKVFYEMYTKCFYNAIEDPNHIPSSVEMFLNFGYIDRMFLDDEKVNGLFKIATHMELCKSANVYTIFEWLKAVYNGEKNPSKNEFDMDFNAFLLDEYKNGNIKKEQIEKSKANPKERLEFEINNMFKTVNRLTYGSISGFTPVLNGDDLYNDADKMIVTADKLSKAINEIRNIDFSAFYRPIYSHGLGGDMNHECIMREILPDIILMPNAGTKSMMWQETASVKNDTPARFMIPIFTGNDLNELLVEMTGRYRWEMCRNIEGTRWNDIREHSLTAEYYDYLQFYKKNRELSPEVKEQIKGALVRSKNSFREVFVMDYQNWLKYEAKGGFRLNKYVRRIMFKYVPFAKEYREKLKESPMFTEAIGRYDALGAKTLKRLNGLYDKYQREEGDITPEMKDNLTYYQL